MASNPTKILLYDLDADLGKLMDSLKQFQGTYTSINDRLMDLTTDTFSDEVQLVIDDLISGYQDGSILTIQRIANLKKALEDKDIELEQLIAEIEAKLSFGAENIDEVFTYDPTYGNVTKHEVSGDRETTVDYMYADLAAGKLDKSVQIYTNKDGKLVTITKTYTYDANENITNIKTVTTIAP